jgi:hypothetical protein
MDSLTLVLGTGKSYDFNIGGTNLTTSVTYSSGCLISRTLTATNISYRGAFSYSASGTLAFKFLDNVKFGSFGLSVNIANESKSSLALFYVQLPPSLHGWFEISDSTSALISPTGRWHSAGARLWITDAMYLDPSLRISVTGWSISADLRG